MQMKTTRLIVLTVVLLLAALGTTAGAVYAQGTPSFSIVDWRTEPERLERGQEFDLTFTFTNVGSAAASALTVNVGQSSYFVSLSPTQYFGGVVTNVPLTARLRVAVANNITTGHYALPLQFSYQVDDFMHTPGSEVRELGVYVHGLAPSTGQDTGRPQVVIDEATIEPGEESGQLNLTLALRNVGDRWATGIVVNLGPSEVFSPADGDSTAYPLESDLNIDQTKTITLPLTLIQSPGERVTQDFTVEYRSYSGGSYQSTQSVPIVLGGVTADTPRLLIESYTTDPVTVTPGITFRLDLSLVNVGGGEARRVFVRLGKDAATLGPLAPLGSSNVRYVEQIEGGDSITLGYTLAADGNAEAGLVPIDVELEYEDSFGVKHTETETISLRVESMPYFQIGFFEPLPETILVGDAFDLPIEVINIGRQLVNVSTVEVTSNQLAITEGVLYLGPLDGGTSGTMIAQAEALEAGEATVTVRVSYLDSFQQPRVVEHTLSVTIESAPPDAGSGEEGNGSPRRASDGASGANGEITAGERLWRAVLGFLGLGTNSADGETETM